MSTMPSEADERVSDEQHYLDEARAALTRMRESTLRLDAAQASDKDSTANLARTLARRVAALQDDPHSTLFFGRIDRAVDHQLPRLYVGRRHISDEQGDPLVIDWRALAATAFYRASRAEPMDVVLRRRFGVDKGIITAVEDELLTDPDAAVGPSQLLADEIERPRTGPMRDIVSTIQPEQDEIVRADVTTNVCVQGAPGTGKTAVGLHRAAWLLYTYRDRLERSGVLVIGPGRAFLDHIAAVLPALGEIRVLNTTVDDLVAGPRVRRDEPVEIATLKGDERLSTVLHRAVWSHVRAAADPLIVPRGIRKWRVPAYTVQEVVDELAARGVRYDAARAMLPQRLAHQVLLLMEAAGDSPDDRVQDAVARSAAVRAYVKTVWPVIDPAQVLWELWSLPDLLASAADGVLNSEEQSLLLWDKRPRTKGSSRWSRADLTLLDEVGDLIARTPSLGHVVLDEAQDLSPMQLRAVGRRCSTGSVTVLGDIAQGTTPWATDSWQTAMHHLGKDEHHLEVLGRGFRVPASVVDFAARLLPHIAPGLPAPQSVRDNPGRLELIECTGRSQLRTALAGAVDSAGAGSVGIIVPDELAEEVAAGLAGIEVGRLSAAAGDIEDHRVQIVPATVAKGLEFDHVMVVDPAGIVAAEPDRRTGLRRLYVVLTRAVSTLTVLSVAPLPPELTEPLGRGAQSDFTRAG